MIFSKRNAKVLIVCVLLMLSLNSALAESITVYVTKNPPLICVTGGKLDCIGGKLLKTALEKENLTYTVVELPWARAQEEMSKNANSIFAATGRNQFTEDKYNWFFKVYSDDVNIFTRIDNKITSNEEIPQKVKKVAIRIGSPFFAYANDLKIPTAEVTEWYLGARQVSAKRVDGMLLTTLVGEENFFNIEKINRNEINRYKIGEMQWWIVRPKGLAVTPELTRLSAMLEKQKESPEYQDVLKAKSIRY